MALDPPKSRFSIAVLEDPNDRLLMVKRAPHEKFGANQWGFPAGHIESGESALECIRRELDEEIGLDHELRFVKSIGPFRDTFYGGQFEIDLFHYAWIRGEVELNEEHTEYAWVSKDQFDNYEVLLGIEQDIVLLDIWPRSMFDPSRLNPNHPASESTLAQ